MKYEEFKNEIEKKLLYINMEITENEKQQLYKYMKNLIEWNEKINLTAIKEEKEIILKHFVDSIKIVQYIGNSLIDIGSGAGFPGIPIKICKSDTKCVLIDSVNKKINFINDTIEKLELENIIAIHTRAEELAHDKKYRESFDTVTSRAVANLSTLVEYMLPFVKIGGSCVCMKGPNVDEEIEEASNAIKKLGGKIEKIERYKISKDIDRTIIIIKKEKHTEQTYPRKQGKPLKEPLK